MMNSEFWRRCVKARCVIVPVEVYSEWGDGVLPDETKYNGIQYAALPFEDVVVGPDYWFMLDEQCAGAENLYETPGEALAAYEDKKHV